ncbi:MAG: glycosyltransferase family 9 protein [Bacteroidetes bacterium]|nr:glycosyltransferase family 9 protein [Bacteroidota bacterium]
MSRQYSKAKVKANYLLEKIAFVFLYPFLLIQRPARKTPERILLIEPFQLGDVMSLTPLIAPLQTKYPNCKIYFFSKPHSVHLLKYDSRVSGVFTADFPWSDHGIKKSGIARWGRSFVHAWRLRIHRFDLGIDTRGDVRSQILLVLAGCKSRLGYTNYLHSNINLSGHLLTKQKDNSPFRHRYQWNLDLLSSVGFTEAELFPIKFPCYIPDKLKPVALLPDPIVIHVGGGWVYRRWPTIKWIALVAHLQQKKDNPLFIIGGPGERDIILEMEGKMKQVSNLSFKITSAEEMVSLIGQSDLFICLDSGPMNLATCLNKKIIALFGPGDSSMWKPLNLKGRYIQKVSKFPCSPCLQLVCVHPTKNCMDEITVEDVMELVAEI